ncbi:dynein axonemal assembly factor 6 isoform X1 [Pantherophis guttatus]|uniref:Dynein axonemal assembly factor 6 isoform X1 n=1 Tax=Pantherophis guttatus TaxID=94885 RepID=A0A6P9DNZ8_PANGU|nr:dynein axonemal assembly factor 6 isoform X1 [Pantherophis guttatus]
MATRAPLPANSLLALAELLSLGPGDGDEDSADAAQGPAGGRSGPGSIGPLKAGGASAAPLPTEDGKAIWSAAEVPEGCAGDASWDPREQPEYEIVFKQQVRAEDLFLGMSRKDPSTACCEDMLIKIKLPDTKASDITLDIQEKLLDFRSPQKRLLLHLPHPVDATNGKARFLSEQATLEVTLRMKRELDFINFS